MTQRGSQVIEKDSAFARVVATHRRALLRYAIRRLDNVSDAEDLVAETFVVTWRRFDELPSQPRTVLALRHSWTPSLECAERSSPLDATGNASGSRT